MNTVFLPSGKSLPALGLGTWRMGESKRLRTAEVAAVRFALELGYRVIDTAEMYGEGGAEEVVGQALDEATRAGPLTRDQFFIVSKVYPHNATVAGVMAACERSRRRLRLDRIDLYPLHWRGPHPLQGTVAAFEALRLQGRIGEWGVSNFDTVDLIELQRLDGGPRCATNQVYYSLGERGPEHDLLPWQRAHRMPLMAYSPIDQGDLAADRKLRALAAVRGLSAVQLALAWVLSKAGVIAIPKAVQQSHLRANFESAEVVLDAEELAVINRHFPPPERKTALAMR